MLAGCPGAAWAQPAQQVRSRVRPGCTGAAGCSRVQQGAAGAQPEAPQARSQVQLGAAGAQPAAPQGRTRGAAGVQPAQRVPQGALSDKLRRTSETNKKNGPFRIKRKLFSV